MATAKAKRTKKAFPETLFIIRENEGTQDEYWNAVDNAQALVDLESDRVVAEYKLVRKLKVAAEIKVTEA